MFMFTLLMQCLTVTAWMWFFLGVNLATVEVEAHWTSEAGSRLPRPDQA